MGVDQVEVDAVAQQAAGHGFDGRAELPHQLAHVIFRRNDADGAGKVDAARRQIVVQDLGAVVGRIETDENQPRPSRQLRLRQPLLQIAHQGGHQRAHVRVGAAGVDHRHGHWPTEQVRKVQLPARVIEHVEVQVVGFLALIGFKPGT